LNKMTIVTNQSDRNVSESKSPDKIAKEALCGWRKEPMKILVVEAEETTQKVMGVMLTRLGYKVELTSNCNEAFRAYSEKGPFDVVLISTRFVRGSAAGGSKFIDEIRRKNPDQHYAFVTGSPVLRKPFTLQELDDFMGAFRRPASSRFG
jgi:CheY-like chemotaxis protein